MCVEGTFILYIVSCFHKLSMSFELSVHIFVADTNFSLLSSGHYQPTVKLLRNEYHLKEIVI